ncbi:hypothetical protein BH23GEM10_BH23GEM10_09640 [soil metagenome]
MLLPLLSFAVAACASSEPAINRMAADELFLHGLEQLQEEEWSEAVAAFERFTLVHASHPRATEARYRLGEAYMGRREYITAALEFNRLAAEYPNGPWADDARFHVCASYEELSLPPMLDQEYTLTAIEHCRSLLTYHPDSEYVERAGVIIERLTNRLAEKEYRNGEHYFKRNAFDSAIIYYLDVADRFPQTVWAPRALLRLVQSYGFRGYAPEAEAARERLLLDYPDSPEARQLNGDEAGDRS